MGKSRKRKSGQAQKLPRAPNTQSAEPSESAQIVREADAPPIQQTLPGFPQVIEATFAGPLPPPMILEGYERILPGAAERIVTNMEQESTHRREIVGYSLKAQAREGLLGQIFGFLIGIFAIGCGTYAATNGAAWYGSLIGAAGVVGLVSVFVYGRRRDRERSPDEGEEH